MRWPELTSAGALTVLTVLGVPWQVVLILGLAGLLNGGWARWLQHRENMRALDRTTRSGDIAEVVRANRADGTSGSSPTA